MKLCEFRDAGARSELLGLVHLGPTNLLHLDVVFCALPVDHPVVVGWHGVNIDFACNEQKIDFIKRPSSAGSQVLTISPHIWKSCAISKERLW